MRKIPTDLKILKTIYRMYEPQYPEGEQAEIKGENDPYMPIDMHAVAEKLKCRPEMLFGRLYYHLDAKYRYEQQPSGNVHLFAMKVGDKMHCVNFPYLAAVTAEKDSEHRRNLWSLVISILAIIIAAATLLSTMNAE